MNKKSRLIIVNADDLGISKTVNREIERLHRLGVLSSATILANAPCVEEVPLIHKRNPDLGLGVHLAATDFQALTSAVQSSNLCDQQGVFYPDFRSRYQINMTQILIEEWVAQINRLRSMGIEIDHVDSHHHVHTWPTVLPALREVVRRTGIHWVRNTRNLVPNAERKGIRAVAKYAGKSLWSRLAESFGMRMTRNFCSVTDLVHLEEQNSSWDWNGHLELMCHPGDNQSDEFVAEAGWLECRFTEWIKRKGVLTTYHDLKLNNS